MFLAMAKNTIQNIFKKIPYFEAFRAFLEQWGMWGPLLSLLGVAMSIALAAWGWIESNLPVWGIILLFLGTACLVLILFNAGVEAYRKISAERLDHEKIGKDLQALSQEMARAFNDLIQDRERRGANSQDNTPEGTRESWEMRVREGQFIAKRIGERFGSRIVASVLLLKKMEIELPFHLSHLDEHTILSLASYFGAVGELVESGNISVAQNLDSKTAFRISGMIS